MHEKVLSHIPGPIAKPAREKWITEGTAGSIQPGYEVTGMQSTISGSPPHDSSANRNQEGTAPYSSAPVVLRPAYPGPDRGQQAGESTRPSVPHTLASEIRLSGDGIAGIHIRRSRDDIIGFLVRRCRDGVSCVTWSRLSGDGIAGIHIRRSRDDILGFLVRRCRDGVSCVTWSRPCGWTGRAGRGCTRCAGRGSPGRTDFRWT